MRLRILDAFRQHAPYPRNRYRGCSGGPGDGDIAMLAAQQQLGVIDHVEIKVKVFLHGKIRVADLVGAAVGQVIVVVVVATADNGEKGGQEHG